MGKYGFFSETAALERSYYFYTQHEPPVGDNVVVVTFVGYKGDKGDKYTDYYRWTDKEWVSSIGQIIGQGKSQTVG